MTLYKVRELSEKLVSDTQNITVHGRVHDKRVLASVMFIILRDNIHTIQCVFSKKTSKDLFLQFSEIPQESYVLVSGKLSKLPNEVKKIEYTSHKDYEFRIESMTTVSSSTKNL